MIRTLKVAGFVALVALMVPACGGPGAEEDEPTGVVVDPPETLDFGTVYECSQSLEEVLITNYGPDDVALEVEVDLLIPEGFLVSSFSPEVILEAEDDHAIGIRLEPLEGQAGLREAVLFIDVFEDADKTAFDRSIQIRVTAEVLEGDQCS